MMMTIPRSLTFALKPPLFLFFSVILGSLVSLTYTDTYRSGLWYWLYIISLIDFIKITGLFKSSSFVCWRPHVDRNK